MTSVSKTRYTVLPKDTLTAIAKAKGTTVDALVKANNIKDPNRIVAGQVLRIPDGFDAKPTGPSGDKKKPQVDKYEPTKPATKPETTQAGAEPENLGSLSRKYEATGPGTVSKGTGDAGGVSYGSYQFASKTGSAKEFVDGLKGTYPEYYKALSGKTPGSAEFSAAWKDLAKKDPDGFFKAQHDAIKRTHYDPAVADIKKATGLDVTTRSKTLQDVAWSTSVQHRNNSDDIFKAALKGKDPAKMSDEEIIKAVYAERGRRNESGGLVHFGRNSREVQESVANRFKNESKDALAQLKKEQAGGPKPEVKPEAKPEKKPEAKPEKKPETSTTKPGDKPVTDTDAATKPGSKDPKKVKVPYFSQYEAGHGYTPSDTACFKAAVAMAKAAGANVTGPGDRIQVATGENSKGELTVDPKKAAQGRKYIDSQLDAGKPVVVGVSHKDSDYNADKLTDHFVVITGRGVDEKGRTYYTFHDPGTRNQAKGADTNPNNRFYVDDNGKMYRPGSKATGYITDRQLEVAMVRPNA